MSKNFEQMLRRFKKDSKNKQQELKARTKRKHKVRKKKKIDRINTKKQYKE